MGRDEYGAGWIWRFVRMFWMRAGTGLDGFGYRGFLMLGGQVRSDRWGYTLA